MRQAREALGLTQQSMAEALGIGASTYQTYEYGALPKTSGLKILCDMGFNGTWLLTGVGPMRQEANQQETAARQAPFPADSITGKRLEQLVQEVVTELEARCWEVAHHPAPQVMGELVKLLLRAARKDLERRAAKGEDINAPWRLADRPDLLELLTPLDDNR